MKKLIVLLFAIVLLLPSSAFARKKNYNKLCSTTPASAPVTITLSEIGYQPGYKRIILEGVNKGNVISGSPKIYARHAIKNKSQKTITECSFKVFIYRPLTSNDDLLVFEQFIDDNKIRIKPGKSSAKTWIFEYDNSNEFLKNIKNHVMDKANKIVYELYYLGYSDGSSETFNQ